MWTIHRIGHLGLGIIHFILAAILAMEGQIIDAVLELGAAVIYVALSPAGHGKG